MNVLIIGSGGREHALAWKIAQSYHCGQLFASPGNPGIGNLAKCLHLEGFEAIKAFCLEKAINVVVVGPEQPLVDGIYDFLVDDGAVAPWKGIVVGPSKAAARLEGSKSFSKKFMARHGIPTAAYKEFTIEDFEEGMAYLQQHPLPIVLKADGLAAGKGVSVCTDRETALETFRAMIQGKKFGPASEKVVVEAFLDGIETSVFVITDGIGYQVIGHAKDYKRVGEGDTGPNTGGMGCVSPVPFVDAAFMAITEEKVIRPTIEGLTKEGLVYKGFLFFGLMNVGGEPWVVEYNCRLGDPETEVILPRLGTDLLGLIAAMDNGTLEDVNVHYEDGRYVAIVAVSEGYPGPYTKGLAIKGLEAAEAIDGAEVFHSGTATGEKGEIVTNGGRVLTVTALAEDLASAVARSKDALSKINFQGMTFRNDIGHEFLGISPA